MEFSKRGWDIYEWLICYVAHLSVNVWICANIRIHIRVTIGPLFMVINRGVNAKTV